MPWPIFIPHPTSQKWTTLLSPLLLLGDCCAQIGLHAYNITTEIKVQKILLTYCEAFQNFSKITRKAVECFTETRAD